MAWGSASDLRPESTASRQIVRVRLPSPPRPGDGHPHEAPERRPLTGPPPGAWSLTTTSRGLFGNLKCHSLRALDRSYFFRLQVRRGSSSDVLVQTDLRQRSSWILVSGYERDLSP